MRNKFITFEGGEGSGKTTQVKMLQEYFTLKGIESVLTREPGGTKVSEDIRDIFINSNDLDVKTELLLNMSARSEHIDKLILPAISDNKIVICDRFIDSTYVYQGVLGGFGGERVFELHDKLFEFFMPDLTFFMDIHPEECLNRISSRVEEGNRFDNKGLEYHIRIYNAFKELAVKYPDRIKVIDASADAIKVHNTILEYLL